MVDGGFKMAVEFPVCANNTDNSDITEIPLEVNLT
jgi:hypothetical protein